VAHETPFQICPARCFVEITTNRAAHQLVEWCVAGSLPHAELSARQSFGTCRALLAVELVVMPGYLSHAELALLFA
jgi:hypothetical protein